MPFDTMPQPESSYTDVQSHRRICLLTDGYSTPFVAKTAISILRYRSDDVAAVIDRSDDHSTAQALLGAGGSIPVVPSLAAVNDSDSLYIGIAPPGGKLPLEWRPIIREALNRKLDVVSGLHDFLSNDQELRELAAETGARLFDIRRNNKNSTAQCVAFRPGCLRIHAVGRDCSVGKMVTTLEIQRGLAAEGHDAKFLATGQTGIMIEGEGVPIDCVVSDFINGAAEELTKRNDQHDFLLIEGQGSISHPAYSAVTLGLMHGCAPDGLIYCYEAGREQVKGFNDIDLPSFEDQFAAYQALSNLRHPCKIIGIAVNTRTLSPEQAAEEVARAESTWGLPACDVIRDGADQLVAACINLRTEIMK